MENDERRVEHEISIRSERYPSINSHTANKVNVWDLGKIAGLVLPSLLGQQFMNLTVFREDFFSL